jgi:flavin-dependent dehydrogenase
MVAPHTKSYDALVLGAGPAGTAAAATLAARKKRVLVLERERFPRYHIGESLIPYCWFPLQKLGLTEALDRSGFAVRKLSVQFASVDGNVSKPFYFFDHVDHPAARTWQVLRADFDRLLLDHARSRGAEVHEEVNVRRLLEDERGQVIGVEADYPGGARRELRAPLVVDATGRNAVAQTQYGWRRNDPSLKKMAIWTYYEGAQRDHGLDAGATTVASLPEEGWFWYIPLPDDKVSVGIVHDHEYLYREQPRDLESVFARCVARQPWVREHLSHGRKIAPVRAASDYSYRSQHCARAGLVLTGDAFAFLDPVFSSGVFLALTGGVLAGEAAADALDAGDVSAQRFREYGERFCEGMEAMRRIVYAFYDPKFNFGEFVRAHPEMRAKLTDCLIGNVEADLQPLFDAMGRWAGVPEALAYGGPMA